MMPDNDTTTNTSDNEAGVSSLHYPRTGKRGVPQQFPRRLYEMLQSETKLIEASADHPRIIFWSDSGKAFRIADVTDFSATILPKYFRTKKFSSFQRNLNLYGFAKVRRGPETDFYAHPSFVRDQEDTLSHLRKLTSTSNRRRAREATASTVVVARKEVTRSVSPSPSQMMMLMPTTTTTPIFSVPMPTIALNKVATYGSPKHSPMWAPIHQVPPSPESMGAATLSVTDQPSTKQQNVGRGRLDLLAMAMEQAAAMQ